MSTHKIGFICYSGDIDKTKKILGISVDHINDYLARLFVIIEHFF